MKVIRKLVFETNSSSTHSICISKADVKNFPKAIGFCFGEYGWEDDTVYDTADYLYTAIYDCGMEEYLDNIKSILDKNNIVYTFETPKKSRYGLDTGYVDHAYELKNFIVDVCNDEQKLLRFLFGDSVIYTGNDNSSEPDSLCNSCDEFIWDDDTNTNIPNPKYHPDKYDYYYKGN